MPKVFRRPAARRDLIEHFAYLAQEADEATAERFFSSADDTFLQLAQDSSIGTPLSLRAKELVGLRKWRVRDFPKHLIFYLPRPEGVSIVRVLYGNQDWWGILGLLTNDPDA
jgi:toxin ParE1/3/4